MKNITISMLVTLLLLVIGGNLFAQSELTTTGMPYKTPNSVLYGSDVIIDNQPTQDQRSVCLSVAFNGWLYVCYTKYTPDVWSWVVMRSLDDGATWMVVRDQSLTADWYVTSIDIVVTGNTEGDLKLFVARTYHNNASNTSELKVSQYDAVTGVLNHDLRDNIVSTGDKFLDVAIASDYRFPAVNSSPFSLAVLYSKYNATTDSIRILTSSNGGATIDGEQLITSTGMYVRNVALSYGRCWNYFNGRYYAAWEQRSLSTDDIGQMYTAHSTTYFYDPFTTPYRLDNLMPFTESWTRNPSICTQFNDTDNDSLNITDIVLFERAYNGNTSDFDVVGLYNMTSTNSTFWTPLYMGNTYDFEIQPDISFDPGWNNFLATYCNLTTQSLRYVVMGQNMPDPNNWWVINEKYNDFNNLVNPYPKVEINPMYLQVAHVWSGEGAGVGMATYDAEYSHLGVRESAATELAVTVTPNPATTIATFRVTTTEKSQVIISLYNMQGQELLQVANESCQPGTAVFTADVSTLPNGCYFFRASAGIRSGTGRLIVTK